MSVLSLVYAPHSIFKQKAAPVEKVDGEVRRLVDNMLDTLYFEKAVGLGANMVGVLKKIAVIDMMENGISKPYCESLSLTVLSIQRSPGILKKHKPLKKPRFVSPVKLYPPHIHGAGCKH